MRKTILTVCFFLLLIQLTINIPIRIQDHSVITVQTPQNTYVPHSAIDINNEAELTAFPDKTGTGSESDPYIISNLEITGVMNAIIIDLITSHLIIRDCFISATSCIKLNDCSNIDIINCTIVGDSLSYGIFYDTCTNIIAIDNSITTSNFAFILTACNGLLIHNNVINITNYGFQSGSGLSNCNITNNMILHSNVKGFVIGNPIRLINNTIGYSPLGMQLLSGSQVVINNTFYDCDIGIQVTGTQENIIGNTFHHCLIGLDIIDNSNSIIQYNFFYLNGLGLKTEDSHDNAINYNYFCSNNQTIYYTISPILYDSIYIHHNYYSDYQFQNPNGQHSVIDPTIWDFRYGKYNIYGDSGSAITDITYDNSPLIETSFNLPTIIEVSYENTTGYPTLTFQEGTLGYNITWIGIDNYIINGTYWIFKDDVEIGYGIWDSNVPISINLDMVASGNYTYTIRFFDHLGEFQENSVSVYITPIFVLSEQFSYIIIGIAIAGLIGVIIVFYIKTNNCEITDTSWSCRLRNRLED